MDIALAKELSQEGPIVFYDGACGLCDRSVRALIRLDKGRRLRYATLQGETAARLFGAPEGDPAGWSVRLLERGRLHERSTAAIRVARAAGGAGRLFALALLVPRSLRDGAYRLVARNRLRLFGGAEACLLPTPALRQRFLP